MKNLLLLSCIFFVFSCGSKNNNQVNSGNQAPLPLPTGPSIESIEISPVQAVVDFEGSYDIRDQLSDECPSRIRIIRECDGYILQNNSDINADENFCNMNTDRKYSSLVPNKSVVVTQEDNQLKAVVTIGNNIYTNSITLEDNTYLTKETDYKSRNSVRCFYEKRKI